MGIVMWQSFLTECHRCNLCAENDLLDPNAIPILMKNQPKATDILFVLEAPNRDDTYNQQKKCLTIDPETDPSGRFFYDLFVNELKIPIESLFVTNSVLCLPAPKNGGYPVTSLQTSHCTRLLRQMIDVFNPILVCPVGAKALLALNRIKRHGYKTMATAVAKPTPWYGRTLFPLYHTSMRARNPFNGRPENLQREDWRSLKVVCQEIQSNA